ncbi:hypothetical protein [Noviherbaspirillum sp.]|uniref:hypothetical protein n=1 Tax=Noviherbaspirillum sp. TaxID=1926288 RepID=UPI002FE34FE0
MKTPSGDTRLAQPADEEIKVHGDQLKKQVEAAAGGKTQENQGPQSENIQDNESSKSA